MRITWEDLVLFQLIKQVFSDQDGNLRLNSAENTMESIAKSNIFLRRIIGLPTFVDVGGFSKTLTEEDREFEIFMEGLKPIQVVGKLDRHSFRSATVLSEDGMQTPIRIVDQTQIQSGIDQEETVRVLGYEIEDTYPFYSSWDDYGDDEERTRAQKLIRTIKKWLYTVFATVEKVYRKLTRKKNKLILTAKAIISDASYQMIQTNTSGDWSCLAKVEEFLQLHADDQQLVHDIMCDQATARSAAYMLAFILARCAVGGEYRSAKAIKAAVKQFNEHYAPSCKCDLVEETVFLRLVHFLDIQDGLETSVKDDVWADDPVKLLFVLSAIANKISPWNFIGESIAVVLAEKIPSRCLHSVAQYLPLLFPAGEYEDLICEILDKSQSSRGSQSQFEDLLFSSLCFGPVFKEDFVGKACDYLFRDQITNHQVLHINDLLEGKNGTVARKYLMEQFHYYFKNGNEAAYHFVLAAILNKEAELAKIPPLPDAVRQAKASQNDENHLLGLTRTALYIWMNLEFLYALREDILTDDFVGILLSHLKQYDCRFYSTACSVVHDLIVGKLITPDILLNDPDIYKTAVQTLMDRKDGLTWAEQILSVMPFSDRQVPELAAGLISFYKDRFTQELQNPHKEPAISYGLLVNLGCWPTQWEKESIYEQLRLYYQEEADFTSLRRMELLRAQLKNETYEQRFSSEINDYFLDGMK